MITNNHPAHAPLTSRRLHQMRDILSKAAAQRDGGDIGYAMSDAVKLIDAVLESEPVACIDQANIDYLKSGADADVWTADKAESGDMLLYASPQLPRPAVVPLAVSWEDAPEEITEDDMGLASAWAHGFNQCRAAMLNHIGDANKKVNHSEDKLAMVEPVNPLHTVTSSNIDNA